VHAVHAQLPAWWPDAACRGVHTRPQRRHIAPALINRPKNASQESTPEQLQNSTHCERPPAAGPLLPPPPAADARLLVLSLLARPQLLTGLLPVLAGRVSRGSMLSAQGILSHHTLKTRWQAASRCASWRSVPVHVRACSTCRLHAQHGCHQQSHGSNGAAALAEHPCQENPPHNTGHRTAPRWRSSGNQTTQQQAPALHSAASQTARLQSNQELTTMLSGASMSHEWIWEQMRKMMPSGHSPRPDGFSAQR